MQLQTSVKILSQVYTRSCLTRQSRIIYFPKYANVSGFRSIGFHKEAAKEVVVENHKKVESKAEELDKPLPNSQKHEVGVIQALGKAVVHGIAIGASLATTIVLTSFSALNQILSPLLHKIKLPGWLSGTIKVLKYTLKAIEAPIRFVLPKVIKLVGFAAGKVLAYPLSMFTEKTVGSFLSNATKSSVEAAQTVSKAIDEAKEAVEKTTVDAASKILEQNTDRNTASVVKDLTELGKDLKETVDSVSTDIITELVSEAGKSATSKTVEKVVKNKD